MQYYWKDSEFAEALDNPEALEKRLSSLKKDRKVYIVGCIFFFVASIIAVQISAFSQLRATGMLVPVMLFGCLGSLVFIVAIQGEVRTLLAFKKLRETSAPL